MVLVAWWSRSLIEITNSWMLLEPITIELSEHFQIHFPWSLSTSPSGWSWVKVFRFYLCAYGVLPTNCKVQRLPKHHHDWCSVASLKCPEDWKSTLYLADLVKQRVLYKTWLVNQGKFLWFSLRWLSFFYHHQIQSHLDTWLKAGWSALQVNDYIYIHAAVCILHFDSNDWVLWLR